MNEGMSVDWNDTMKAIQPDLRPFHPSHSVQWSGCGVKCMLCGAKGGVQLRAPCPVSREVLDGLEDSDRSSDGGQHDGHSLHLAR